MWAWILKAVVMASRNPAVQAWAANKAEKVIGKIKSKAEKKSAAIAAVVSDIAVVPEK